MVDFIRKDDAREMLLATKEFVASLDSQWHTKAKTSPNYHPLAWDLMRKLLVIDPHQRLTAEEAYIHPFFNVRQHVQIASFAY